jgi:hypothetical protein
MLHVHADRMGQAIPPLEALEALEDEIDKRIAGGESETTSRSQSSRTSRSQLRP